MLQRLRALADRAWVTPLVVAVVAAVGAQAWFEPGSLIAFGDNFPVAILNPDDLLAGGRWLWGHGITPTGGVDYVPGLYSIPALIGKALQVVGMSAHLRQRVYLTLLFVGMALSMYLLLRVFLHRDRERLAAGIGSLFYVFNPAMFNAIPNAAILANLALLPLLPALILRGSQTGGWRYPVLLAVSSIALSYGFVNPPMFAIVVAASVVAVAVALIRSHRPTVGRFVLRSAPLMIVVNLWWLVPVGLVLFGPAGDRLIPGADPSSWTWTHERGGLWNVLRLVPQWSWPRLEYFPYASAFERLPLSAVMLLPAMICVALPLMVRGARRRAALVVLGAGIALVLLAKGLHPPLVGLNEALYRWAPGMWLFREPQAKFTFVLAGVFAAALALLVASLRSGRFRVAVAVGIIAMTAWISHPIWLGTVVPGDRPILAASRVEMPDHWSRAADFIDARPGRVLLLPPNDYYQLPYRWGYYGVDVVAEELMRSPVMRLLDPTGNVYIGPDAKALAVMDRLTEHVEEGEWPEALRMSRALGVRWLLIRGDVDWRMPDRELMDPARIAEDLASEGGVGRPTRFGPLTVFEVPGAHRGRVWVPRQIVVPDGEHDAHGMVSVPLGAGAALAETSPNPAGSLDIVDRVDWREYADMLQAHLGSRAGTVYARWVEGMPLRLHTRTDGGGGTIITLTSGLTVDGAAVHEPLRDVELQVDSPGEDVLPALDGSPLIGDAAAVTRGDHEVGAFVRVDDPLLSDPSFETGTWGKVDDCRAEDGRSPKEAGLRARRVPGGRDGAWALELSARAHSACIRQSVTDVREGALYRLRMDHRHLSGQPPRICVWQVGPDRCASLPPLTADTGWQLYDRTFIPEQGTTELILHLYADGDPDGTRAHYDDVRLHRYEGAVSEPFRVPGGWVSLGRAGEEAVASLPRPSGDEAPLDDPSFEAGTWEPVGDCFAEDDLSGEDAGLLARRVPGGVKGDHALELSARAHAACVSQETSSFAPGALYRLTLAHRRLQGSAPRFCVWEVGPEECAPLPAPLSGNGWERYDVVFRPRPETRSLRLFLYADGEPGGTRILYDDVRLRATPPRPEMAVLDAGAPGNPPRVTVTASDPSQYRVSVTGATEPFILVLDETYDDGWRISGAAGSQHLRVNGYANGWVIDRSGTFELRLSHGPQTWVGIARVVSAVTLLGLVLWWLSWRIRRMTRRPEPRGGRSLAAAGDHFLAADHLHVPGSAPSSLDRYPACSSMARSSTPNHMWIRPQSQ